jgi:hypothetical protein
VVERAEVSESPGPDPPSHPHTPDEDGCGAVSVTGGTGAAAVQGPAR